MKKLKNRVLTFFNAKRSLEKDERYVESVITRYLETDVKKLMSPQGEYLIIDEANEVYISFMAETMTISNHDFLYRKTFSYYFSRRLEKKIRDSIKKDREELRKELFKNEIDLLQKIKDKIK